MRAIFLRNKCQRSYAYNNFGLFSKKRSMLSSTYGHDFSAFNRPDESLIVPKLPVVREIGDMACASGIDFRKTAFFFVQHTLDSNVSLLKELLRLNARPSLMYWTGKSYSTNPAAAKAIENLGIHYQPPSMQYSLGTFQESHRHSIDQLWECFLKNNSSQDFDNLIIVSDGGTPIQLMPKFLPAKYRVSAIEQTTKGVGRVEHALLTVNLAALSWGKKFLEAPIIADDQAQRLDALIGDISDREKISCAIIGNGAIGTALTNKLLKMGFTVYIYDKNPDSFNSILQNSNVIRCQNLVDVVENCDYFFGCSGQNVFEGIEKRIEEILLHSPTNKRFISCSSEDIEWYTIIEWLQSRNPGFSFQKRSDVSFKNAKGGIISLDNFGEPDTFHNLRDFQSYPFPERPMESIPPLYIQLTRSLMFLGILQSHFIGESLKRGAKEINTPTQYQLSPSGQQFIAKRFFETNPEAKLLYPKDVLEPIMNDINLITKYSGGQELPVDFFKKSILKKSRLDADEPQRFSP